MTDRPGGFVGERRDFELGLAAALSTASGTIDSREGSLVMVTGTADGADRTVGVGEATPLPGWTESLAECRSTIDRALSKLETSGPDAALAATEGMPAARHGLSLALLDRDARLAGEPLYRHLGSDAASSVTSVPVNATAGDGRIDDAVRAALEARQAGFETLKLKVGVRETAIDAGRLEAIRTEVSEDLVLRVDANGAWSRSEARLAIGAFPDLEYVEQPLPSDDLRGHADLRERADVALDEALRDHSVDDIVDADAADVIVIKPMVLGGIDRALGVAERAWDAGIDPVVTTTIDGVVARAGAVHLAAGLGVDRACGLATADKLDRDLAPDPTTVRDGRITVPQAPGTGVTVEW